jgi:hypothetical protein
MLTAAQRKRVRKILAAYAPIRATLKDPPRHRQNAPQPKTARMRRIPFSEKIRAEKRASIIKARALANNPQLVAELMAQVPA